MTRSNSRRVSNESSNLFLRKRSTGPDGWGGHGKCQGNCSTVEVNLSAIQLLRNTFIVNSGLCPITPLSPPSNSSPRMFRQDRARTNIWISHRLFLTLTNKSSKSSSSLMVGIATTIRHSFHITIVFCMFDETALYTQPSYDGADMNFN